MSRILRSYIRSILREDYGGFGSDSEMGMDFTGGDHSKLYKTFVEPFTDVFKTAAGKGKELSQKVQTLGKTALETIGTTLIPALSSDYDKIRANEKSAIEKIRSEYSDVFNRNWEAIYDNDILSAAFMMDPLKFMTATVAKQAPKQAFNALNVLAGGELNDISSKFKKEKSRGKETMDFGKWLDKAGAFKSLFGESVMLESSLRDRIASAVNSNPRVQSMQKNARAAVRDMLEKIYDASRAASNIKTVEDLKKIVDSNTIKSLAKLREPEKSQAISKIAQASANSAKSFYVKQLSTMKKNAIDNGVSEDHPLVRDIDATIAKIKN